MQIGLLGFGKMGRQIAEKLMADGHEVVLWNRSKDVLEKVRIEKSEFILNGKLVITRSIEDFSELLSKPRIIWSMLPAGEPTETALAALNDIVEAGDIIIDGGNSHIKDTQRHIEEYKKKNVKFLGIGVSGGVHASENGCCLMVGGAKDGYEYIIPVLDSLIKPNGIHTYFGEGAAGHFVKMVHNGIEYGIMQSLAEGYGVLAKSNYKFNLLDIAKTYQKGSIVSGFLNQMVIDALTDFPNLSQFEGIISATVEGKWMIEQAKVDNLPIKVIEDSLEFRTRSQYDKLTRATFAAKMIVALRKEFGGHEEKKPEEKPQGTS